MVHLLAVLPLLSVLTSGLAVEPTAGRQEPLGDWAGWAYFDEGGDSPLRLRIDRGPKGLRVRFDELVRKAYDLPATLDWDPPRLVVTRTRPTGTRVVLDGQVAGSGITGRIDWAGHQGDFELSRSPQAIARIHPERFEGLTGTYRLTAERSLVVTARFWGELLVTDLGTGRHATLFPVDTDSFFVGSALYVPGPIHARIRFLRNDAGEVVSATWHEIGRSALSGTRTSFAEEDVSFESDGVRLEGTLIRPEGSGPLPAAVVIPGSNWTDREAGRRDAEILASFGMMTLVYDKRGNGQSGGEPVVSFRQTARDAVAAIAHLSGRGDVLSDQVGLVGRSRGGWIAPLAASMTPDAAFVVLFVPPAVSPAAQETTRRLNLLEREGFSAEERSLARAMLEAAWSYARDHGDWERYVASRERAAQAGLPAEVFEPSDADDPEWEWTRLNMDYDPIPALESLGCPVLALFGEEDRNVVAAENLPPMRAALARGGNRDHKLIIVPGADHGLRVVPRDLELPYHRKVGFGSAGWPEVGRWLAERVDLIGPSVAPTSPGGPP